MFKLSALTFQEFDNPKDIGWQLARLEPFAPIALSIHGIIMLLFMGAKAWQWGVMAIIFMLGVWGISKWRQSENSFLIRAGLIFGLTWVLLFNSGGVNSFFLFWYFVLITVYPSLLPSPFPWLFIVGIPLSYLLLWPLTAQPIPVIIIFARVFLLAFLGWVVWALGMVVMRYAREHEKLSTQLRERERVLYKIIDNMPVMMDALDDSLNYVMWNKECERVTGYSAAEIIGNPRAVEMLYPDDEYRQWVQEEHEKRGNRYRDWVIDITCKDGSIKQIAWSNTSQDFPISNWATWNIGIDVTSQLQAEAEVRENTKLLKAITDNFPYAYLAVINSDFTFDFASGREFKNQRLDSENSIGLSVQAAFGHDEPEKLYLITDAYEKTFAGEPQTFDLAIDNQYLLINTVPMVDEHGSIPQILALVHNITERKQAERELETVQARLTGIIESAMDAIITIDHEQRIILFNQAAEQMFGLAAASAMGQKLDILIPERFREIHHEHVAQFAQSGITSRLIGHLTDVIGLRTNGQEFPIEAAISQITIKSQKLLTVILRDISETKEAEARIHYQANLLNNVQDAIIATDAEFAITAWNKGAEGMYGWLEEEVLGQNISQLLRSEFSEEKRAAAVEMLAQDGQYRTESTQYDRYGQTIQVEGVVLPLYNEHGQVDGYVTVNRNITQRKELEDRLRQAQKMEAIGHLAGGIAHDFNNILVPIIGYTELSMIKVNEGSKIYSQLSQIKKAADRATSLIHQILAFSRKQVLTMQPLDLKAVVVDFQKMIHRLIGEDIELKTILNSSWYPVRADKTQIEQVLMNLAVNARDAMPKGGKLTIETSNIFLDEAYVAMHPALETSGPYAVLQMSDTGHGMDKATAEQIFEPFFTTKERGKGTGLGLATVFGIVRQHQGYIEVESEPNQGTTFKIYLPLVADAAPLESTLTDMPRSVNGTETVLVVEDEEMVRRLVCETLAGFGYLIIQAENPDDCLQQLQSYQGDIHLLLTDVIMPAMNGQALYHKVLQMYPTCRVLYMSGYTDNVIMNEFDTEQAGVGFLQKPFNIGALSQKVRETLDS